MTHPKLAAVAADPARAAILLDFDGTLAPIVAWPEDSRPTPQAREVLVALASRFLVVAVISARPTEDLVERVGVDRVRYLGLYGLARAAPVDEAIREQIARVAAGVPGAWIEPKGATLAVHYRGADHPTTARASLAPDLASVAAERGYDLLEGKMVFELAPAGESRKGGAVTRIVGETEARAVLYAGDDLPDLEAFAALDELATQGVATVKVAVGGAETPDALLAVADIVVGDPRELVSLLAAL